MWPHLPQLLIATTSTNLTKLLISLSPNKTFDNLYQGDKKLLSEAEIIFLYPLNKSSNVLITYNEIIGFAKLVEVIGINHESMDFVRNYLFSSSTRGTPKK